MGLFELSKRYDRWDSCFWAKHNLRLYSQPEGVGVAGTVVLRGRERMVAMAVQQFPKRASRPLD